MNMMILLLLLLYITIIYSISNDMTVEKCLEYGFNSTDLECKVINPYITNITFIIIITITELQLIRKNNRHIRNR